MPKQLTAACEWVVKKHGVDSALTTGEIKKHLAAYGYHSESENFSVTLMKTLKRLLDSNRIAGEKIGHNWSFKAP